MQIITDRSQALTAIRTDLGAIRWFGGTAAGYACLPRRSRRRGSAGRRLRRLRVQLNHAQLRKDRQAAAAANVAAGGGRLNEGL